MEPCLYHLLDPALVGADVESFVHRLVSQQPVTSVELRVIRPQPGFEARRAADVAGPGLDATHNDTDTREPFWFFEGDDLPTVAADDVICFTSQVGIQPLWLRRLLLLDFRVPVSDEAQRDLEGHLTRLGWRGVLAVTGSSYHFLGVEALLLANWVDRMHRSLLIPGIDWRYIGHSLVRRAGAARFTTCALKPTKPRIVAIINPDGDIRWTRSRSRSFIQS